jgi:hypothetical protein
MPIVLFVVKANIVKDREEEFNRWYQEEHAPMALQYKGVVKARRYKAIMGEDKFQYMTVYEFQDEPTFRRFYDEECDHLKKMRAEYAAKFGGKNAGISERQSFAYLQVWP